MPPSTVTPEPYLGLLHTSVFFPRGKTVKLSGDEYFRTLLKSMEHLRRMVISRAVLVVQLLQRQVDVLPGVIFQSGLHFYLL